MLAKSKLLVALLVVTSLAGCTTATKYDDFKRNNDLSKNEIDNRLANNQYEKVLELERPPQQIKEIKPSSLPDWLDEKSSINAKRLPLSLAIKGIVGDGAKIKYGLSVDPSKPIEMFFEGTKREALNILELEADYGITYDKEMIYVDKFVSKTYKIPTIAGEESYQLGSSNSGGGAVRSEDAIGGKISSTGSGDGQQAFLKADDYNITDQIYKGINKMLSGEGNITTGAGDMAALQDGDNDAVLGYAEAISGASSIVVRTSPGMMKLVDEYVKTMVDELTREVTLELTVIEYQAEDGAEFGLDAVLNRDTGRGNASFNVSGPSLAEAVSGMGLGFEATSGVWNGTTAMINALRKTGTVGVKTQQRLLASNHKAQEIDLSSIESYISSAETTFEGEDNNTPVTTIEKSEARDGVKLLALANIQDSRVHLKLNGVLSKVVKWNKDTINGITIQSPETRQSRFNISGAYNYNETFIVTHMRQETNESNENRYVDVQTGNSGSNKVVDTLVLLTPRKASR